MFLANSISLSFHACYECFNFLLQVLRTCIKPQIFCTFSFQEPDINAAVSLEKEDVNSFDFSTKNTVKQNILVLHISFFVTFWLYLCIANSLTCMLMHFSVSPPGPPSNIACLFLINLKES